MKIDKKRTDILFFSAYTLAIIFWMTTNVKFMEPINPYLIKVAYIMLLLKCLIDLIKKYELKSMVIVGTGIIISSVSWYFSKSSNAVVLWLFVVAAKDIEFKEIVKFDIKIRTVMLILVLAFYFLGLTDNFYDYRDDGQIRSSMGFAHPNTFGMYVFLIACEFMYIRKENIKIKHYVFILIAYFAVAYFADSRTSQIAMILLVVGIIALKFTKNKLIENKITKAALPELFLIFTLISFVLTSMYGNGNGTIKKVDNMFTGRIRLAYEFIEKYEMSLFGNKLELISTFDAAEQHVGAKVLDNGYVKIMLQDGIIYYIFFAALFYFAMKSVVREKDYVLCLILSVYLLRRSNGKWKFYN